MCDTREVSFKHQLIHYQKTVQKNFTYPHMGKLLLLGVFSGM